MHFGSRARGTNLPKSDIDIAIEGCPNFASLEDRLQEQLWSLLKIDVVNLDGPLSESLRHEISRAYEADRTAAAGPRDIIKASNSYYDFMVEETWLAMPRNRNNTAHVYDENAAKRLMTASIEH